MSTEPIINAALKNRYGSFIFFSRISEKLPNVRAEATPHGMAPWRRAGQWSLRLPCAAPGRHAVWGRLSSEGLGGTRCGTAVVVGRSKGTLSPLRARTERGRYSAAAGRAATERLAWQGAGSEPDLRKCGVRRAVRHALRSRQLWEGQLVPEQKLFEPRTTGSQICDLPSIEVRVVAAVHATRARHSTDVRANLAGYGLSLAVLPNQRAFSPGLYCS